MSNGYLTTHVLDIFNGTPGKGIRGEIFRIENEKKEIIQEAKQIVDLKELVTSILMVSDLSRQRE